MADLKTDVRYIKGVGEQRAKALEKLGILTLRDLISWFPRRYEDRTETRRISQLIPGETACVAAMVAAPPVVSHMRGKVGLSAERWDIRYRPSEFFSQTCTTRWNRPSGSSSPRMWERPVFTRSFVYRSHFSINIPPRN